MCGWAAIGSGVEEHTGGGKATGLIRGREGTGPAGIGKIAITATAGGEAIGNPGHSSRKEIAADGKTLPAAIFITSD
jgi:hypothetical protein